MFIMKLPPRSTLASKLLAAMTLAAGILPIQSRATDLYWGGWDAVTPSNAWATAGNWYTDAAETAPSTSAPTVSDDLFFNTTPDNSLGGSILLSGSIAANSLTFGSSATTTISQNTSGTRTLTLGPGGITVNTGAAASNVGVSTGSLFTEVTASQTWTNNSSSGLSVRRVRTSDSATGPVELTLSANGTGGISFANSMGDSADGTRALSIVIDSAGTGTVTFSALGGNPLAQTTNFTGGTTIKRGNLAISTSAGTGKIELGDTTGTNSARLSITTSPTITNAIDVRAGSSGTKSISISTSAANTVLSGDIALFGDLLIGSALTSGTNPNLEISGVISGAGNLTVGAIGTRTVNLTLSGANTHSGNTLVSAGTFTLAESGSMTFDIGANGINNRVSGGGANAATFNGTFNFDLSGADLTDGNSWLIVDVDTLTESFSGTFAVAGFSDDDADNIWTKDGWSFSELSGILTYAAAIPEPSTYALMMGAGLLGYAGIRRKARRADF